MGVVKRTKSLKRKQISSFSDFVFFSVPEWRNFRGPTEFVSELKVIFS